MRRQGVPPALFRVSRGAPLHRTLTVAARVAVVPVQGPDPAGGPDWKLWLRIGRRVFQGPRYMHQLHAAKAARDVAMEIGLDPWADVEVGPW